MIGLLPKELHIEGEACTINSDYRAALTIFEAFEDPDLTLKTKQVTMLEILYDFMIPDNVREAHKQAIWFLNVGDAVKKDDGVKTLDYKQDEQLLFSSINKVAGHDIREDDYLHWWTFYGLCQAIDSESLISTIVQLRYKMGTGKKLEKWEREWYANNRHLVDLKSAQQDYDAMVAFLRGM